MEKKKNRRKILQTRCGACNTTQDPFRLNCKKCKADLPDGEEAMRYKEDIDEIEQTIKNLEAPGRKFGNPYVPVDRVKVLAKELSGVGGKWGLGAYSKAAMEGVKPHEMALHRSTLKANLILLMILSLIPVMPLALGWSPMVTLLMLLPAALWAGVTLKAFLTLRKAGRRT